MWSTTAHRFVVASPSVNRSVILKVWQRYHGRLTDAQQLLFLKDPRVLALEHADSTPVGNAIRGYADLDDIVQYVQKSAPRKPPKRPGRSSAPYRLQTDGLLGPQGDWGDPRSRYDDVQPRDSKHHKRIGPTQNYNEDS